MQIGSAGVFYLGPQSVSPGGSGDASNGLSIDPVSGDVVLGQNQGAAGTPAQITNARELPFDLAGSLNLNIEPLLPAASLNLFISPILFNWVFDSSLVQPQWQMNAIDAGSSFGIFYDPAADTWFVGASGENVTFNCFVLISLGLASSTPTAQLELGTASGGPGQGQLKFNGPSILAVPETGVMEYNNVNLFFTRTGTTRENILTGNSGAAAPGTTGGGVPANFYGTNGANYLGQPNNWVQVNISGTNFKIPLYT